MPYTKYHDDWEDLPSVDTPIDAAAMEQIETGIATAQSDAETASAAVSAHASDSSGAHAASAISVTPAGSIASTDVQAALEEIAAVSVDAHLADTTDAHDASAVSVAPTGTLGSTNVQGALAELDMDLQQHLGGEVVAHAAEDISVADALGDFTATDVEGVLAELQADHEADATALTDHVNDTSAAHAASAISYAGGTGMAATDVEAAIDELADEKVDKATFPCVLVIAIGDETTAITTGTAKTTFRMPHAMTLTAVRASLTTVSSSGIPTFDINETGATILSTKLTVDANEKTSTTAATAAVISDTALADDAEVTIDVDVAGTGAAGAKIYLIGTRSV